MLRSKVNLSTQFLCLLILGCLTGFSASWDCPFAVESSCGAPWYDYCCSYGSCNVICNNCDGECIYVGCSYNLLNSTFHNETKPKVPVSNVLVCSPNNKETCEFEFTVEKAFESHFVEGVHLHPHLAAPIWRAVVGEFHAAYGKSTAEKTKTGFKVRCPAAPGTKSWVAQSPKFAILSSTSVYKCCNPNNSSACTVNELKVFQFSKPLIFEASGINMGDFHCENDKV